MVVAYLSIHADVRNSDVTHTFKGILRVIGFRKARQQSSKNRLQGTAREPKTETDTNVNVAITATPGRGSKAVVPNEKPNQAGTRSSMGPTTTSVCTTTFVARFVPTAARSSI